MSDINVAEDNAKFKNDTHGNECYSKLEDGILIIVCKCNQAESIIRGEIKHSSLKCYLAKDEN